MDKVIPEQSMSPSRWFPPPRYLLTLFLGIVLMLSATLAWLGWRLLQASVVAGQVVPLQVAWSYLA
jgi:hypothetical protein